MKFNEDFSRYLLLQLLTNDRVLKAFVNKIKPEYFSESASQQKIMAEIRSHYSRSGDRPSPDFILQKLTAAKKDIYNSCITEMGEIIDCSMKITEREFDALVREFILHNALIEVLGTSIDNVEKGEYDQILSDVKKVFDLHGVSERLGLDPFDIDCWRDMAEERGQRVPTVWNSINQLTHGGIAVRELAFVLGREAGFKSFTLANVARGGLIARAPTVIYTLEMGEIEWGARLISMMTGQRAEDMIGNPEIIRKHLDRLKRLLKTPILIKQFPTSGATLSQLKSHLASWEIENKCKARLVIVDSADLLSPEKNTKEYRHGLREVWQGLRGWAVDQSFAIWTAKHTTRYSGWNETLEADDTAEDKTCMRIADFAMGIQQTKDEYKMGMLRFGILKWRNGKASSEVAIEINEKTVAMKEFIS
jgi:replicative DNA helicase